MVVDDSPTIVVQAEIPEGLNGLLDCLDQCINYNFDLYKNTGIIIVERPLINTLEN